MMLSRLAVTALLAVALAVSACGVKGDPVRPGQEDEQTSETED